MIIRHQTSSALSNGGDRPFTYSLSTDILEVKRIVE